MIGNSGRQIRLSDRVGTRSEKLSDFIESDGLFIENSIIITRYQ
jgi:hypothetical protein